MPSSVTSSKSTSPENETLSDVLSNDRVRYERKGYGLVSAICIACAFFMLPPLLLRPRLPGLLSFWGEESTGLVITTLFLDLGIFWTLNLAMAAIYWLQHPFFEKYKTNLSPWPWNADPQAWRLSLRKTLVTLAVNQLVLLPALIAGDVYLNGIQFNLNPEDTPSLVTLVLQIVFCMLAEDCVFYFGHRMLHSGRLYRLIHKQHHEYTTTIGLASFYAHPLEFIFANVLPTSIGPKLLGSRCHIITFWMWNALRTAETVDGHCGYDFSWSPYRLLPLSGGSAYHDFHHSHNVGNFGSFFSLWDTICGTNACYFKYLSIREQDQKTE